MHNDLNVSKRIIRLNYKRFTVKYIMLNLKTFTYGNFINYYPRFVIYTMLVYRKRS